jgi:hypothetical protein
MRLRQPREYIHNAHPASAVIAFSSHFATVGDTGKPSPLVTRQARVLRYEDSSAVRPNKQNCISFAVKPLWSILVLYMYQPDTRITPRAIVHTFIQHRAHCRTSPRLKKLEPQRALSLTRLPRKNATLPATTPSSHLPKRRFLLQPQDTPPCLVSGCAIVFHERALVIYIPTSLMEFAHAPPRLSEP